MARFRLRDSQKKVGLSFVRKNIIITTLYIIITVIIIIYHLCLPIPPNMIDLDDIKIKMACRPDRHFLNWFRPDRRLDQAFQQLLSKLTIVATVVISVM